jgi:hypothetical protein
MDGLGSRRLSLGRVLAIETVAAVGVKEVSDVLHVSLLLIQFHDLFPVDHAVKGGTMGTHRADETGVR